jgi:Zn-dependent metalloprotease
MPPLAAQQPTPQARETANRTEQKVRDARAANPALRVKIDPLTGLPSRITGLAAPGAGLPSITASEAPSKQDVERAVRNWFATNPMGAAFPQIGASNETRSGASTAPVEYAPSHVRSDPHFPGQYIAQVEQRVGGVPVFGSTGKLTVSRSLSITQLTANFSPATVNATTPQIPQEDAIRSAREALIADLRRQPEGDPLRALADRLPDAPVKAEVSIFDPSVLRTIVPPGPARLSWLVTIESFRIFIDGETRAVLHLYRDKQSGLLRRVFDLNGARLHPGTLIFDDAAGLITPNPPEDADKAFVNSSKVYQYFATKFARDSFDDSDGDGPLGGGALEASVRHGTTKNAFWCVRADFDCPKGNVMVYGPGYAGALDVVGHEMMHGLIAHEANLIYDGQPGAVNESLADIFGALIELETGNGNWLLGETLPGFSAAEPLRSLADPLLIDANGVPRFKKGKPFDRLTNRGQPDHSSGLMERTDEPCSNTDDRRNGCVHFNSGVLNKAAFLIAEGGTHSGIAVTGIGANKLGHIAYRTLTTKLNANSTLVETGDGFLMSCFELNSGGLSDFTATDCENVQKAFQAVGLSAES